jgi:hypothetical protein
MICKWMLCQDEKYIESFRTIKNNQYDGTGCLLFMIYYAMLFTFKVRRDTFLDAVFL